MQKSAQKSQKTSSSLDNLHVNDWQKNSEKIRTSVLHLVFRHFQDQTEFLLDSRSKINTMSQAFA